MDLQDCALVFPFSSDERCNEGFFLWKKKCVPRRSFERPVVESDSQRVSDRLYANFFPKTLQRRLGTCRTVNGSTNKVGSRSARFVSEIGGPS